METGSTMDVPSTAAEPDRVTYEQAYRLFVALENPRGVSDTNSAAFQQMLQRALNMLRQGLRQRALDGVLSDNESFFELQNEQLYAFLLEYFLAMLIPKLTFFQQPADEKPNPREGSSSANGNNDQQDNVRTRIRFLREADVFHTQFLDRAESMGILTETKRREQYERMDGKKFTLSREQKIERFKLQRDMEAKLQAVQERKARLKKGEDDDELEDAEREQLMTFIQLSVVKCLEEQASINQERDMLETMVRMNDKTDARDLFTDAHRPPPPPQGQGISVTHINPQFEMRRETIRSQVFQPGHRLPTMSLEELAEREYADAVERQKREAEAPVGPRRYEQLQEDGDEDDHALVDEATLKDRAWDDWKDANPRGIGNKKGSQF